MCGRFALVDNTHQIMKQFGVKNIESSILRYNIAPTETILAIQYNEKALPHATTFRWGLIPSWAKQASSRYSLINARAESVFEKPVFKRILHHHRCLIPMSGYFEWHKEENNKQPYFIHASQPHLLAAAGIWSRWRSAQGEVIDCCCIITTEAIDNLAFVHPRMPLFIDQENQAVWLDNETGRSEIGRILHAGINEELEAYKVSTAVNSPSFKTAKALEPIDNEIPLGYNKHI